MRKKERTPFGERLFTARTGAGLSQPQLAKAVGLSQSTIGELEWKGEGSSKTAQIAAACGVRPEWLATGKGAMKEEKQAEPPKEVSEIAAAFDKLKQHQIDWAMRAIRNTLDAAPNVGPPPPVPANDPDVQDDESSSSQRSRS